MGKCDEWEGRPPLDELAGPAVIASPALLIVHGRKWEAIKILSDFSALTLELDLQFSRAFKAHPPRLPSSTLWGMF